MLKKLFIFIICLLPWFATSLIRIDYNYFELIKTPFFTPPKLFYPIAWTIIYILIAITISYLINNYKFKNLGLDYKVSLIINYLFNQSYVLLFFGLKNNFLGFVSCLGTFITSLFLYYETYNYDKRIVLLLIPYILLSLFATILSLTIYFINLV